MNQINLGPDAGIDTDHVQYWEMRDGEEPTFQGTEDKAQTRVQFKNGKEAILRGDAKVAFDAWAKGRRTAEKAEPMSRIIERARIAVGQRCGNCAWRQSASHKDSLMPTTVTCRNPWRPPSAVPGRENWCMLWKTDPQEPDPRPLCATCACYEAESGHCTEFAGNHYRECWVAKEGESLLEHSHWHRHGDKKHVHDHAMIDHHDDGEPTTAKPRAASKGSWPPESGIWSKCGTCSGYYSGTRHCEKGYPVSGYPECYVVREKEAGEALKGPICAECSRWNHVADYCVDGTSEYPDCFGATEAAHKHWHDHDATDKFGQPGRIHHSHEHPDTKATGAGPAQKAKVLLLSRIWECSKCGEVLAVDIMTGEPVDVSRDEVYINGEVRIQTNDVPLVVCLKCRTANLWPEELRERAARSYEKSLQFPKLRWSPKHNHMMVQESVQGEERATVHTHMHSSCGSGGTPHEHPHVIGDHHGGEEASYPNEKRYVRSDTQ